MTGPDVTGPAAALAGLPGMGPRRLTALLDAWDPPEAWSRVASGQGLPASTDQTDRDRAALCRTWAARARDIDPAAVAEAHRAAGLRVLLRDDPAFPAALLDDLEPPAVLFVRGDLSSLDGPRVAIVGTRRCTGVGAGLARELGRELAVAGVTVVSGLALGIDGAAHRGVLDARGERPGAPGPVAVVGSGLDVVYPARHWDLWEAVAAQGLLLSEAPLGARPEAWRFPARNRIIAALADVVVVVESHAAGGSLLTVHEAERRDRPVLAAPGSVRNPASAGTNQLLADGCQPVRDTTDVLVALGLTAASRRGPADQRQPPDDTGRAVLAAFDWEPATFEHLAVRTGLALPTLALAVESLVASGWVIAEGGWYERAAA
jgi:DNA processing protein